MTFLTTRYQLKRDLAPKDYESLRNLSTVYGIRGISTDGRFLTLEYDASRIHEAEVWARVREAGLAAQPEQPIPAGSYDHKGEFRDFTWPTEGLSPANQKE